MHSPFVAISQMAKRKSICSNTSQGTQSQIFSGIELLMDIGVMDLSTCRE